MSNDYYVFGAVTSFGSAPVSAETLFDRLKQLAKPAAESVVRRHYRGFAGCNPGSRPTLQHDLALVQLVQPLSLAVGYNGGLPAAPRPRERKLPASP